MIPCRQRFLNEHAARYSAAKQACESENDERTRGRKAARGGKACRQYGHAQEREEQVRLNSEPALPERRRSPRRHARTCGSPGAR